MPCKNCRCSECAATACNSCGRQVFSGEKPDWPGGRCSECYWAQTTPEERVAFCESAEGAALRAAHGV